jgi:hypothetical protein
MECNRSQQHIVQRKSGAYAYSRILAEDANRKQRAEEPKGQKEADTRR